MSSLWISGGRVVDPASGVDEVADLLVSSGKIASLHRHSAGASSPADLPAGTQVNLVLSPWQTQPAW